MNNTMKLFTSAIIALAFSASVYAQVPSNPNNNPNNNFIPNLQQLKRDAKRNAKQYKQPKIQKTEPKDIEIKSESPTAPPSGIIIGETVISPGDNMKFIFSIFGVPDHITAMRDKKSKKKDYIQMRYIEESLFFNIRNDDNTIRSIMITGECKIKNVPFSVGMRYDDVKAQWGEPDKKESGYANYIKKGIVFKVSDTGIIELIAIFPPGNVDSNQDPHGKDNSTVSKL